MTGGGLGGNPEALRQGRNVEAGRPRLREEEGRDGAFVALAEDGDRSGAEGIATAGFEAPRTHDLAKALGTKNQVVEGLVAHLIKGGALVRLSPDVIAHSAFLAGIEEKVAAETGRTMSVGDFRDLLGLSRKYLIPLLEYLDRKRRTRRVGDARVVE